MPFDVYSKAGANAAFATAAQGAKADTAVQPAALAAYATDAELADTVAAAASTTRGVVAFTYDDAYTSWRDVSALASARGQRNTFMVTTNMLNSVGKITTADVEALYAAGHEIGAHSKTHANLTSIGTAAARVVEYDTPKTVLEGIVGVGNIKSWAYPFGAFNTTTNQELYGRYQAVYGIGYVVPCAIPLSDRDGRFLIGRQPWNQATHETVLGLIRLAATTPIAVVIYCHDPGNTSGGFPTDPTLAQVAEAYDLAAALGVPSVRCSEAIPSGNLVRNGGFEEGLTGWQTPIAKPASITFEAATDTPVLGLPGTKSMHIGATVAPGANFIVEQVIPAKPNTSYSFSSRWRMENFVAGELVFSFQRLDYAGNVVGETFSSLGANSGWAASPRTVITEANCVSINMKYTVGATFRADAYVDHIDLRPTAFGTFG
jgi:peptidoglycan/xylan/chitin deacetylase (PgdA/CDA1 family)